MSGLDRERVENMTERLEEARDQLHAARERAGEAVALLLAERLKVAPLERGLERLREVALAAAPLVQEGELDDEALGLQLRAIREALLALEPEDLGGFFFMRSIKGHLFTVEAKDAEGREARGEGRAAGDA